MSLEQWRNYSQNRASIIEHPYLTHEAELMRRIGSNKRVARQHIETLTGKVCTMKDMHNLYARLKKREDTIKNNTTLIQADPSVRVESVLQQFVDTHVENHVSILSDDEGFNEAICISSKAMREHFQVFSELCLLEVTICQLPGIESVQLHGFLTMDALGNAKPVFVAQSLSTTTSLLRRICRDFKRTHPKWVDMKVIVMDKLLPDVVNVVNEEFMHARVLLCQFYVIKFLSSLVMQPEFEVPTVQLQEHVRELLKQMVFAPTEQHYLNCKAMLQQVLEHRLDNPLLMHIDQHWEPYRSLWASYARVQVLEFSQFFTKGLESFWNPLKAAFERNSGGGASITGSLDDDGELQRSGPIAKCISEVLMVIKFIEDEWTAKMLILEMTKPTTEFSSDPLLHFLVNCLSSFAVSLVSSQLTMMNSSISGGGSMSVMKRRSVAKSPSDHHHHHGHHSVVHGQQHVQVQNHHHHTAHETDVASILWTDKICKVKNTILRDCSRCDCDFYMLYHLPCQHLIWYELTMLKHKQVSMSAVGPRWFLRTFQVPKIASQRESNEVSAIAVKAVGVHIQMLIRASLCRLSITFCN